DFQAKNGLTADGIVGRNTLAKLDRLLPGAAAALPALPDGSWITHRFKIVMRSIAMPKIPEFQALDDTRRIYGQYGFRVDEGGGRRGVTNTDIMVYFVNDIQETDGSQLNGCAGHKPGEPAVVVSSTANKYDMAHEVGHVLLGPRFRPVHHPSSVNLMFEDL